MHISSCTFWFKHRIYRYFHLHGNKQITLLQYNHDGIQKKNQTTYTNLVPFEEKGAQLRLCLAKLKTMSCIETYDAYIYVYIVAVGGIL